MVLVALVVPTSIVKAWNNGDHVKMAEQGLVIFKNDFKDLFKTFPDWQKYSDLYLSKIKAGASDADAFSTTVSSKVYKGKLFGKTYELYLPTSEHYYDPATGRGALGYFRSARAKADEYYATAKQKFAQKNYDDAFLYLGRAIHMVQDTANPHHTQIGIGAIMNWDGFANYVSANFAQYSVTVGGIYNEPNIGQMVHDNAVAGRSYFKYVDGLNRLLPWFNVPTNDDYSSAATVTVARAERASAGVMAMFLEEVLLQPKSNQEILKAIKEKKIN